MDPATQINNDSFGSESETPISVIYNFLCSLDKALLIILAEIDQL
jgi:hypothetical protein